MGINLTGSQLALLREFDGGKEAKVYRNMVWVNRRPYALRDVAVLRAAGFVKRSVGQASFENRSYTRTAAGTAYLDAIDASATDRHEG